MDVFLELVIAALGLVIAYFQWNAEKRAAAEEKKEEENRRQEKLVIQRLLKRVSDAEQCSRTIAHFNDEMSAASKRTDNQPGEIFQKFDRMLENYEKNFRTIAPILQDIYDELLKNEERFPMSNGYDRYITELRDILDFDAVERQRRLNDYDSLRIRGHYMLQEISGNGGGNSMENRMKLGHMVEQMVRALEPYHCHAHRISAILYELKTKYNAVQ